MNGRLGLVAGLSGVALALWLSACGSSSTGADDVETSQDQAEQEVTLPPGCSSAADCDDSDPCTTDECGAGGTCTHEAAAGTECDDGNACTTGDACSAEGVCVGAETVVCQDENPCTTDSCDTAAGCVFAPSNEATECDGALCTSGDTCDNGTCVPGSVVACNDPNPDDCTYKSCNPDTGECDVTQLEPETHPCADGNPCTDDDTCDKDGLCQPGPAHDCISQHPCKTAWCNEQAKEGTNPCVMDFLPEGTPCDDGSKCTDADACTDTGNGLGQVCSGTPLACDDGNECTLDTCAEETGCVFEPKTDGTLCGQVVACGSQSTCQGGVCKAKSGVGCDDGVDCTVDSCQDGSCVYTPYDSACDDLNPCTLHTCDPVFGCSTTPVTCPPGQQCEDGNCVAGCTPTDGGWTDWTCGACTGSSPCSAGQKECKRTCSNPPPSCGGAACEGPDVEAQSCGQYAPESHPLETGTHTYGACGQTVEGKVPAGKTQVTFLLWGAGGGGGAPGPGGGGAFVKGTLAANPGDTVKVLVGCAGQAQNGGGGASYVYRNGTVVMVAAGGGGGGSDGCSGCSTKDQGPMAGAGGGGGALSALGLPGNPNNHLSCNAGGGAGGTQSAGGAGGVVNDQSVFGGCVANGFAGAADAGGANHTNQCGAGAAASFESGGCSGCGNGCGGGGGSGHFGGGSGSAKWTYAGGGGGGGSSWVDAQVSATSSEPGAFGVPGGKGQPEYNGTAGTGGQGCTDPFDDQLDAADGRDGQATIIL
jgi:hypothetical protein